MATKDKDVKTLNNVEVSVKCYKWVKIKSIHEDISTADAAAKIIEQAMMDDETKPRDK